MAVLTAASAGSSSAADLQRAAGLRDRVHFLRRYLEPLVAAGRLDMTEPATPRSRNQRYLLSAAGRRQLEKLTKSRPNNKPHK